MEVILIVLTSSVISALLLTSFYLGYKLGCKKEETSGITVTKDNQEAIEQMIKWINFKG